MDGKQNNQQQSDPKMQQPKQYEISDHESGQEGDFDEDLQSLGTFGISARA